MDLRNRETVAGAVAREIDRIDRTGDAIAEGAAYKAAFDRAGSGWAKHCDAFKADCHRMDECFFLADRLFLPRRVA